MGAFEHTQILVLFDRSARRVALGFWSQVAFRQWIFPWFPEVCRNVSVGLELLKTDSCSLKTLSSSGIFRRGIVDSLNTVWMRKPAGDVLYHGLEFLAGKAVGFGRFGDFIEESV